jgi:hypothetical protein
MSHDAVFNTQGVRCHSNIALAVIAILAHMSLDNTAAAHGVQVINLLTMTYYGQYCSFLPRFATVITSF